MQSACGAWFSTWRGPLGYEIRDLKITAGDDVAFCRSLNRLSGTTTDGEKADVWFRLTLCFRKIASKWRIGHQHESVPFYMDGSYRAAVGPQTLAFRGHHGRVQAARSRLGPARLAA